MAATAAGQNQLFHPKRLRRRRWRTGLLYALVMLHEFRWTLLSLLAAVAIGAVVYRATPAEGGATPSVPRALYHSWMAMLAQPRDATPPTAWVGTMCALYPI